MIESGSSLFYLLHCSTHDRLNTMTFRSFRNIPHGLHRQNSNRYWPRPCFASAHPARIASVVTSTFSLIVFSLPQHIPHGLHRAARGDDMTPEDFASAHPARIASNLFFGQTERFDFASAHPARIASLGKDSNLNKGVLCLSTSRTDCIKSLSGWWNRTTLCLSTSRTDCISR